jgi:DNA-binding NarL/FixJ family response regulator
MIHLMLVDDQQSMITGLKALLSTHDDFTVTLTAHSGEAALAALEALVAQEQPGFPEVVLMDIRMPGMGGVEATRLLKSRYPQVTILILTTFDDDAFIIDALHYGASGYLLKDIGGKRLIESIYEALSGNLLLTGRVANKLATTIRQYHQAHTTQRPAFADLGLSEREQDVARYLVQGMNAREISEKLHLSIGTIKNYTSSIYSKIGSNDRSKAILVLKEHFEVRS